jgi:hypothetical protein
LTVREMESTSEMSFLREMKSAAMQQRSLTFNERLIKRGAHGAVRRVNRAGRANCKLVDTNCCQFESADFRPAFAGQTCSSSLALQGARGIPFLRGY